MRVVLLRWLGAQAYASTTTKCVSCTVTSHCQISKLSPIPLQAEQADLAPLAAALAGHYVCENKLRMLTTHTQQQQAYHTIMQQTKHGTQKHSLNGIQLGL